MPTFGGVPISFEDQFFYGEVQAVPTVQPEPDRIPVREYIQRQEALTSEQIQWMQVNTSQFDHPDSRLIQTERHFGIGALNAAEVPPYIRSMQQATEMLSNLPPGYVTDMGMTSDPARRCVEERTNPDGSVSRFVSRSAEGPWTEVHRSSPRPTAQSEQIRETWFNRVIDPPFIRAEVDPTPNGNDMCVCGHVYGHHDGMDCDCCDTPNPGKFKHAIPINLKFILPKGVIFSMRGVQKDYITLQREHTGSDLWEKAGLAKGRKIKFEFDGKEGDVYVYKVPKI